MSQPPTVVVRKGGFLSAFAIGLFTFLTGVVICGTTITFYGLHIVDNRSGDVVSTVRALVAALPEWQKALPPAVSDALLDQRDPSYRAELQITTQVVPTGRRPDETMAIVEIRNDGSRTVSLLALRLTLEDEDGRPLKSISTYAATPLAIGDDDWRGPLLPGSTRRLTEHAWPLRGAAKASVEVNELRVWTEADPGAARAPQAAAAP